MKKLRILKKRQNLIPEEDQYASFKSEIRKKQWLSYRILLKKMISPHPASIEYDAFGKPYLKNSDLYLSISHSGDYSAVIVSKAGSGWNRCRAPERQDIQD